MTYRVRIYRRAESDLQRLYDYVAREAPERAGPFIDELCDAIDSLDEHPHRGARPRDPLLRELGYRFLVHGDHLVLYLVSGQSIQVRRVVRGSRAYRNML